MQNQLVILNACNKIKWIWADEKAMLDSRAQEQTGYTTLSVTCFANPWSFSNGGRYKKGQMNSAWKTRWARLWDRHDRSAQSTSLTFAVWYSSSDSRARQLINTTVKSSLRHDDEQRPGLKNQSIIPMRLFVPPEHWSASPFDDEETKREGTTSGSRRTPRA